jgi:uncharacterized protein (TIGR02466 family)
MGVKPGEMRTLFPTTIMQRRLDGIAMMNGRLREIVLGRMAKSPGIKASNVGGWHSDADLMEWKEPEARALCQAFLEAGRDATAAQLPPELNGDIKVSFYGGCWANVNREGGYNKIHNHPGAVWSGCYYVSVGKPYAAPDTNGWIEFQDPRPGNLHGRNERIKPEEGLMLLFPGWLNHFVNPFHGEGERISIAFNLDVSVEVSQPLTASGAPVSA